METLFLILALLFGLAVFDSMAAAWGVDSRYDFDDSHAPVFGAH